MLLTFLRTCSSHFNFSGTGSIIRRYGCDQVIVEADMPIVILSTTTMKKAFMVFLLVFWWIPKALKTLKIVPVCVFGSKLKPWFYTSARWKETPWSHESFHRNSNRIAWRSYAYPRWILGTRTLTTFVTCFSSSFFFLAKRSKASSGATFKSGPGHDLQKHARAGGPVSKFHFFSQFSPSRLRSATNATEQPPTPTMPKKAWTDRQSSVQIAKAKKRNLSPSTKKPQRTFFRNSIRF